MPKQDPKYPRYNCVNDGKVDNCMVWESADIPGTGICKICTCTVFICIEDCIVESEQQGG